MIIYNDNLQIIRLLISEIVKIDTKLRHIDIAQCWLRESIQRGILNVAYLPTAQMIADEMTKLLSSQKHKEFIKQLRLVNTKHLIEMNDAKSSNWGSKLCGHRVSSYSRSSISIRKTDFRISMLISTAIEAFFSQKRSFRDHFNTVFKAYFDRFSAYFNPFTVIMIRRSDR